MAKDNKPKSYTLQSFREELETDATKRNAAQEETIKKLIAEGKEKDKILYTMFQRCKAVYGNKICPFCGHRDMCKSMIEKKEA